MKIGLIGLPRSGKTTVFNALSNAGAAVNGFTGRKNEPNVAIVTVGDERVGRLSAMYRPAKTTYATVELVDFTGVEAGFGKEGTESSLIRMMKTVDALAVVIRNFVSESGSEPTPREDFRRIEEELLFTDLVVADNRIQKLEQAARKGQKGLAGHSDERLMRRIHQELSANCPVRGMTLSPEEQKAIRGYQFLTAKPLIVILNSDESRFGRSSDVLAELGRGCESVEFAGAFEMELARLSPGEAQAFMADMGIAQSARDRLTTTAYRALGLISFFTVGEDEVRAWTIKKGATAVEAAAVIHTDIARGFIRAECFSYNDLMACGSEKVIKERGLLRLEGKEYVVQDGDVLSFRFNV